MIGIVLTLINTAFFAGTWYFLGRSSIYAKLIKEYREMLKNVIEQQRLLEMYKIMDCMKAAEETEEEDGGQD